MILEKMWQLGVDRRKLRVSLPVAGLRVSIDYDADMVDQMIERLTVLRHTIQRKPLRGRRRTNARNLR